MNRTKDDSLSEPLRIRGHHLVCILGFRGLGYDEAFCRNMAEVVGRLRANPSLALLLTDSADAICAACPHCVEGQCARKPGSATRVAEHDRAVLALLRLPPGAQSTVEDAYRLLAGALTLENMSGRLCARCSWRDLGYCAEGLSRLHRGEWLR